jgi:hypothetical protein
MVTTKKPRSIKMMPPTASAHTPGPEPVNAKVPPFADVVPLPVDGLVDAVPAELP